MSTTLVKRERKEGEMMNNTSNNGMANLFFVLCAIIFLNNFVAILLKTEVNKTSFTLSMVLGIWLLINGIIYKRRAKNE